MPKKPPGRVRSDHLRYQGCTYNLTEYLTVADYAQKYNVSIHTLNSRFKRGSLPVGHLLTVPEWGLKLLKDEPYEVLSRGPKPTTKPIKPDEDHERNTP